MQFILFRTTFITVASITVLLAGLFSPVFAAPQFGRPLIHALNQEVSAGMDAISQINAYSSTAFPPSATASANANTAADGSATPSDSGGPGTNAASNGALRLGGPTTIMLASVVGSAVYLVL
ncbi:hypothetical protein CONPUDRAFT_136525 [Coniophora puteana RWD-64-598 SS2]|uniref:Uncharacterized protein n=1 Tax=Coniophora puteana (strain RWD-64-598) TaxID=741705 RepID=A0A5M3MRC1_CONPW|nr:uncharacterized protein CONPUDRAFT_136525 [Coniophora puteana RWD-64-598 SS2]EIW81708.1 hypothetical protein CONPUDRAFT_136525 [Coniophora puteana RWD-64-598 SS2]